MQVSAVSASVSLVGRGSIQQGVMPAPFVKMRIGVQSFSGFGASCL